MQSATVISYICSPHHLPPFPPRGPISHSTYLKHPLFRNNKQNTSLSTQFPFRDEGKKSKYRIKKNCNSLYFDMLMERKHSQVPWMPQFLLNLNQGKGFRHCKWVRISPFNFSPVLYHSGNLMMTTDGGWFSRFSPWSLGISTLIVDPTLLAPKPCVYPDCVLFLQSPLPPTSFPHFATINSKEESWEQTCCEAKQAHRHPNCKLLPFRARHA